MNYRICAWLIVWASAATAGPIVTLDPSNGMITGSPGDTVGWGFTVQADPSFTTNFTASFTLFETNPSIGFYTDFIGSQGGPVGFTLPAGAPDWVETFDPVLQTGIGSFTIDPGALPGAVDSGVIHIEYEQSCSSCFGSVELPFQVAVAAPTPEPGTFLLGMAGLLLLAARRRGRAVTAGTAPRSAWSPGSRPRRSAFPAARRARP